MSIKISQGKQPIEWWFFNSEFIRTKFVRRSVRIDLKLTRTSKDLPQLTDTFILDRFKDRFEGRAHLFLHRIILDILHPAGEKEMFITYYQSAELDQLLDQLIERKKEERSLLKPSPRFFRKRAKIDYSPFFENDDEIQQPSRKRQKQ